MPKDTGPKVLVDRDRQDYIKLKSLDDDSKSGPTRSRYSGDGAGKANAERSGLTKYGPRIEIYDPILAQILAGEL